MVAQVALTVVVLVGAGLVVHTLQNLRNLDPGFATDNLLTFDVDATLTAYKGERLAGFYRDLRDRFSRDSRRDSRSAIRRWFCSAAASGAPTFTCRARRRKAS